MYRLVSLYCHQFLQGKHICYNFLYDVLSFKSLVKRVFSKIKEFAPFRVIFYSEGWEKPALKELRPLNVYPCINLLFIPQIVTLQQTVVQFCAFSWLTVVEQLHVYILVFFTYFFRGKCLMNFVFVVVHIRQKYVSCLSSMCVCVFACLRAPVFCFMFLHPPWSIHVFLKLEGIYTSVFRLFTSFRWCRTNKTFHIEWLVKKYGTC